MVVLLTLANEIEEPVKDARLRMSRAGRRFIPAGVDPAGNMLASRARARKPQPAVTAKKQLLPLAHPCDHQRCKRLEESLQSVRQSTSGPTPRIFGKIFAKSKEPHDASPGPLERSTGVQPQPRATLRLCSQSLIRPLLFAFTFDYSTCQLAKMSFKAKDLHFGA